MSYLVLARKWRPGWFDDLVGQEPIMRILKNAISQGKIAHAYLFSGPRGVGKTSSARILAKALNCKEGPTPVPCGVCASCTAITDGSSIDVTEIDGASNNSVDDIRDLRERVKYAPTGGKFKVYIIDEAHMLSGSAFNALLKTLEEPPSHVIFVLATTEMKKVPATVLSRCQHMPFRRISANDIRERLTKIAESESIRASSAALTLIARAADGSMRDSLTILDQLSSFADEITEEDAKNLLGLADFGLLAGTAKALISGNRVEILETINLLTEQGTDIRSFTKELVQFFRDLLVASVMKKPDDVLDASAEEMSVIRDIVSGSSEEQITLMLSEIIKAAGDVRTSSSPRLALEMALIKASFISSMTPLREAIENLQRHGKQPLSSGPESLSPEPSEPGLPDEEQDKQREFASGDKPAEMLSPEVPVEEVSAPAPEDSEDIGQAWTRTVARIDPPLASKLAQGQIALKDDTLSLVLESGHAVFEDSIGKNLGTIEKILSEEAGRKISIHLAVSSNKPAGKKDLKEKILKEPVIREALELFEGRIVDITPLGNSENGGNHV